MNSVNQIGRNCIKTSVFSLCLIVSSAALSHGINDVSRDTNASNDDVLANTISSQRAKKLTRQFLNSRGFTRKVAAGGASIKNIESFKHYWKVEVELRHYSATKKQANWVYVNKNNGSVIEANELLQQQAFNP